MMGLSFIVKGFVKLSIMLVSGVGDKLKLII